MIKLYKTLYLFIALIICGCAPQSVIKSDVNANARDTRESVIALKEKSSADASDISKIEDSKLTAVDRLNSAIEIKGSEARLKLFDGAWKDFPISIDFNAVPLRNYFEMLTRLTKINFILGDEVRGDLTITFKDVNWTESLDIVLKNKNLLSDVNKVGDIVTIHTHEFVATQSESLQKALTAKMNALKAYSNVDSKTTAIIRLYYTKPDILAQQLKDVIVTLDSTGAQAQSGSARSTRASFVTDMRTNSIIIQASSVDMDWIKTAIANLDKPTRQVLVELFIVEATDEFQQQLGSRVGLFNTGKTGTFGTTSVSGTLGGSAATSVGAITLNTTAGSVASNTIAGATAGGVALTFAGANTALRLELQAMQTEKLLKIVSNPKLFIVDNEQATIAEGQEIPYTTTSGTSLTGPSVQFKNAYLQLQVKPSIIGDGNVYLDLTINKDSVDTTVPNPPISKKELKTKLLVKDGGIAMIGGINTSRSGFSETGVPFLAKLPIFGNLFKSKDNQKNQNQLYIFIAPKVL